MARWFKRDKSAQSTRSDNPKKTYRHAIPPGDHTPIFDNKDGIASKVLSGVFGIVSGYFTFQFLALFIGIETTGKLALVLAISAGVTVLEWFLFRRAILRNSIGAFALGVLISLISIGGSFGAYQGAYVQNMLNSDEYQLLKKQVERWQAMSDKKENPGGYMWAATKAEKAQKELADMKITGAGAGNAVFASVARFFETDTQTAADAMNTALAIIFELAFVAMTIFSALDEKRSFWDNAPGSGSTGGSVNAQGQSIPGSGSSAPETGRYSPAGQQLGGFKIKPGFHGGSAAAMQNEATPPLPEKEIVYIEGEHTHSHSSDRLSIDELNRRRKIQELERLNTVRRVLKNFPNLTVEKQAEKAGMSKPTFIKYRKALKR